MIRDFARPSGHVAQVGQLAHVQLYHPVDSGLLSPPTTTRLWITCGASGCVILGNHERLGTPAFGSDGASRGLALTGRVPPDQSAVVSACQVRTETRSAVDGGQFLQIDGSRTFALVELECELLETQSLMVRANGPGEMLLCNFLWTEDAPE